MTAAEAAAAERRRHNEEIRAHVERIRIGSRLAEAILNNRPLRYPVEVQAKAVASGLTALRDLLAGVLDGSAEALEIARADVPAPPENKAPETKPAAAASVQSAEAVPS